MQFKHYSFKKGTKNFSARLRTFEAALYKFAHYITLHYITINRQRVLSQFISDCIS